MMVFAPKALRAGWSTPLSFYSHISFRLDTFPSTHTLNSDTLSLYANVTVLRSCFKRFSQSALTLPSMFSTVTIIVATNGQISWSKRSILTKDEELSIPKIAEPSSSGSEHLQWANRRKKKIKAQNEKVYWKQHESLFSNFHIPIFIWSFNK